MIGSRKNLFLDNFRLFRKWSRIKKLRLGVIMGGHEADHDLTIKNGVVVINDLISKKRYEIKPIKITKDQKWQFLKDPRVLELPEKFADKTAIVELETADALIHLKREVDAVFLTPLSDWGENGVLQGWLEMAEIPYTGPGVRASVLARDKILSSRLLKSQGLDVPDFIDFKYPEWQKNSEDIIKNIKNSIGFPLIIKPVEFGAGVSRGVSVVKDETELKPAIEKSQAVSPITMVQKFIKGDEVTCYVFNCGPDRSPRVFVPLKITYPESDFLKNDVKLKRLMKDEIITESSGLPLEKIKNVALQAYQLTNCQGLVRIDMIATKNQAFFLEINSLPMLFPNGMVMKAAKAALNVSFGELLDLIIEEAINKK